MIKDWRNDKEIVQDRLREVEKAMRETMNNDMEVAASIVRTLMKNAPKLGEDNDGSDIVDCSFAMVAENVFVQFFKRTVGSLPRSSNMAPDFDEQEFRKACKCVG